MITALISTITGLISGTVPNLLKEWGASREHSREVEMLKIQTELQLKIAEKQGETRVAEMDREVDIAAYESQAKIASASPITASHASTVNLLPVISMCVTICQSSTAMPVCYLVFLISCNFVPRISCSIIQCLCS